MMLAARIVSGESRVDAFITASVQCSSMDETSARMRGESDAASRNIRHRSF